jgi:2-dehydropantoate 2-reductase
MRVLVLGAGATGGYFGGRLMEAGFNVSFIVRPGRMQQLRERGLVVISPFGDLRLPVSTLAAHQVGRSRHPADVILLTCKAWDLDQAIETVRPAMGPQTLILPLLNGLRHLDRLDACFGAERVAGGLCHIPITLESDGTIRHLSPIHRLHLGVRAAKQAATMAALTEAFARSKVDLRPSDTIAQDQWDKFVFLATLAGSTCLMRGSVGQIVSQPGGAEFMRGLYEECRLVAAAAGHPPAESVIADSLGQLVDPAGGMTASMLRDLIRGGRTEAEHILGDMAARARDAGTAAPLLNLALLHLRVHEGRPGLG